MSDEYVDPNSGKAMQPGAAFPGMMEGGIVGPAEAAPEADEGGDDEGYDPSDHTVDDVLDYVADHPDEHDAVLQAEKDGKNRSTLVSALESTDE